MSMNFEAAELAVVDLFETSRVEWTEYALLADYPNKKRVNVEAQELPYVALDVEWLAGFKMDINPDPFSKYVGIANISVYVKENSGYREAAKLLQHFTDRMGNCPHSGVVFDQPRPSKLRVVQGWEMTPLLIPFSFVRTQSGL